MRLHVDRTVRLVLLLLLPGVIVGVALAPYVLRVFGATYAAHGTTLLRLLLLGLPGTAVTSFFTSFLWLERRMWRSPFASWQMRRRFLVQLCS